MVPPAVLSDQNKQAQKKDRGSWRVFNTLEPFNGFQPWLYFLMLQVIHVFHLLCRQPRAKQRAKGQDQSSKGKQLLKGKDDLTFLLF